MSLTGLPLLLLCGLATLVLGAATARLWSRFPVLARVPAVLLLEASLVLTVGLAVNRREEFYPSWAALAGHTGTVVHAKEIRAGRLDTRFAGTFAWRPPGWSGWHLDGPPSVTLPADYRSRPDVEFPVLLASFPTRTPEAVTVTIAPTASTTPADVLGLASALHRDLRVTTGGWAVDLGPLSPSLTSLGVPGRPPADLPPPLAAPLTLPTAQS